MKNIANILITLIMLLANAGVVAEFSELSWSAVQTDMSEAGDAGELTELETDDQEECSKDLAASVLIRTEKVGYVLPFVSMGDHFPALFSPPPECA